MNTIIELKKPGRKVQDPETMKKITGLKTAESLVVKKKDWKIKTAPGQHVLRRRTGREFTVSTLADDSGWLITAL